MNSYKPSQVQLLNAFTEAKEQIQTLPKRETLKEINAALNAAELSIWLHTEFQIQMENAQQLISEDEETLEITTVQRQNAIRARTILQNLIKHDSMQINNQKFQDNIEVITCARALVNQKLGQSYYVIQEFELSKRHCQTALDLFQQVQDCLKLRFLNIIQQTYNTLGLLLCQREEFQQSLALFSKAEEIYNFVVNASEETNTQLPNTCFNNDFNQHLLGQMNLRVDSLVPQRQAFSFFINGGLDKRKLERTYADTLRFQSQVMLHTGQVDQSIQLTATYLHKQLQTDNYLLKEWCSDCIELSTHFLAQSQFCQAEYCLKAAEALLPKRANSEQEIRAAVSMNLGHFYLELLMFQVNNLLQKNESITEVVTHKAFVFPQLFDKVRWPEFQDIKTVEQAQEIQSICLRYFKRSLPLVQGKDAEDELKILQEMSKSYKVIQMLQPETPDHPSLLWDCLKRRYNILPQNEDINPEITHELSYITDQLFDVKYEFLKSRAGKPSSKHLQELNEYGQKCLIFTIKILREFPDADTLIQHALDKPEEEESVYQEVIRLMLRVSDKSERICITDTAQRRALLQQSLSYNFQANQILQATAVQLKQNINSNLGIFVTQNISHLQSKITEIQAKLRQIKQ